MSCSPEQIEAYLDNELNAAQQAGVKEHMDGCPECSATYARLQKQRAEIEVAAPYYDAPPGLEQSVRQGLRRLDAASIKPAREVPWRWIAVAASLLLAISVGWNVVQWRAPAAGNELAENVLSDHIRSLLGSHLVDVVSSDQHTVKPWFAGKLDFSPEVKDLAPQGFPLAGGRVDYLSGRNVAALVYHRRLHVINLFIWPEGASAGAPVALTLNGYQILHWTGGAMTYWAVSDVSMADLQSLRALWR